MEVQRKVQKRCINPSSCLEWEFKGDARVHLSEMVERAEEDPEVKDEHSFLLCLVKERNFPYG